MLGAAPESVFFQRRVNDLLADFFPGETFLDGRRAKKPRRSSTNAAAAAGAATNDSFPRFHSLHAGVPLSREAGVDEAGRGALCGPVVVAAVVLDERDGEALTALAIDDSKKLSEKRRFFLAAQVQARAKFWTIEARSAEDIDRSNILACTMDAMRACIVRAAASHAAVDGNFWPADADTGAVRVQPVVKGDSKLAHIAAASVLAKVYRDLWVLDFARKNPELDARYGLRAHKGYGTKAHRDAIAAHGPVPGLHRFSFRPCCHCWPEKGTAGGATENARKES